LIVIAMIKNSKSYRFLKIKFYYTVMRRHVLWYPAKNFIAFVKMNLNRNGEEEV
jgi:hypothetical protein